MLLIAAGLVLPASAEAAFDYCVEAEAIARNSDVRAFPKSVVLGRGGTLSLPFEILSSTDIRVWVRARAVTHSNNALYLSINRMDASDEAIWDIPVTPVLRWQRATRRGNEGAFYLATQINWPGTMAHGRYTLYLVGREPEVEIDAVCVRHSQLPEPPERLVLNAPQRPLTHNVKNFGAIGDGVSDDTAALHSALAALKPGNALYIPAGRYRFTRPLTIDKDYVSLVGDGPSTVLFADFPAAATGTAIRINGQSETDVTALTADANMLAREVVTAESFPAQAGDLIEIASPEWGPPAPNLTTLFFRNRANIVRILETRVAAGTKTLVIDRPLLGPFLVAHGATAARYRPVIAVVLGDLAVEGTRFPVPADNADIRLIHALHCAGCFFTDLKLSYARVAALEFGRSFESHAIRVHALDVSDTGGGGHGYGVTISRSQAIVVRDSKFTGILRHGVPISWGSRESFVFRNYFDRRISHPNNIQSIDIHGQDDYANLVENNTIFGGGMALVVGGGGTSHGNDGPWNVIRGNTVDGAAEGVGVFKQTFDTVIEGNVFRNILNSVIRVESGSDRTYIWSNRFEHSGTAITVRDSADPSIYNNTVLP